MSYKNSKMTSGQKIIVIICAIIMAMMTYSIVVPYITNAYNNTKNYIQEHTTTTEEDNDVDTSNPGGIVPDTPPTYEIVFKGGI